jgi:sensor c-di-GMP phosphodiesterase-like protein
MSNQSKDSKLFVGIVIGGVIGVGALTVFLVMRNDKESPLQTIGQAILHAGQIFQSHNVAEPAPIKNIEKKMKSNENTISEAIDWIASGIHLWKKLKG